MWISINALGKERRYRWKKENNEWPRKRKKERKKERKKGMKKEKDREKKEEK